MARKTHIDRVTETDNYLCEARRILGLAQESSAMAGKKLTDAQRKAIEDATAAVRRAIAAITE